MVDRCPGCGIALPGRSVPRCLRCGAAIDAGESSRQTADWADTSSRPSAPDSPPPVEQRKPWVPDTRPRREPEPPPVERPTNWVDPTPRPRSEPDDSRGHNGRREPPRPSRGVVGEVIDVGDVREEDVSQPVLFMVITAALMAFQIAIKVVLLSMRLMLAFLFKGAGGIFGGGGSSSITMLSPALNRLLGRKIPVLPFRVRGRDGTVVECVLRGSLQGGSVRLGDQVQVAGSRGFGRGATLHVSKVTNRTTGATVVPKTPLLTGNGVGSMAMQLSILFVLVLIVLGMFSTPPS